MSVRGLQTYILKQILMLVFTILGITVIAFAFVRLLPGDPAIALLGDFATPSEIERLRVALGLDKPLYVQYLIYLNMLIKGDLGYSMLVQEPVLDLLKPRFLNTLQLAALSIGIAVCVGVVMGVLSAWKRGTILDNLFRGISLVGFSIPVFWLALIMMLIFSLYLGLLPAIGSGDLLHTILPAMTLSMWALGPISRVTRACMLDLFEADFVTLARAKGLSQRDILLKHVLRNALIPVVTLVGLQFGTLIGGALVTEVVFNYRGLGWTMVEHLMRRDYPVIQGGILVSGLSISVINSVVDVLYRIMDPRIKGAIRG